MITTAQEYFSNLSLLHNVNQPIYALLPSAEAIYNVDLNNRKIDAPKTLSIEKDHKSEVVYFSVDRFADYMDLAYTCCVIQYNVTRKVGGKMGNKTYFYPVPFFDIYTKADEGKMLFPWCLDASVTASSGVVEFAICFFKIGTRITDNGQAEYIYTYNLNTLPAKSQIVKGIEEHEITTEEEVVLANLQYKNLWNAVNEIRESGVSASLFWTVLPDDFTDPDVDDSAITQELTAIQSEIEQNRDNLLKVEGTEEDDSAEETPSV